MSRISPRRIACGAAVLALVWTPGAAGSTRQTFSVTGASPAALAPVESALEALRKRALEWLEQLRTNTLPRPDDSARYLIPGGDSIGVALMCDGVLVIGTSDPGAAPSPARMAGIRSGDRITHINGEKIVGARAFREKISGDAVTLTVCRGEQVREVELQPVSGTADGEYRIGAWVRDSTAGIGTLTFIDPASGLCGALGHPIQDADTSALMPAAGGALYDSDIVDIRRGAAGAPGELAGKFAIGGEALGTLMHNTDCGIFGQYATPTAQRQALPVADSSEVMPGAAQILTTLDDGAPQAYDAQILRIYDGADTSRSLMLRVTDPELLEATGGIVQGMSGSPILQNGKLVGAVTHVLVNDPTRGYGIFIENMLEAAG